MILEKRRILCIVDHHDPVLSKDHLLFLLQRHVNHEDQVEIKLVERDIHYSPLLSSTKLLPAVSDVIIESFKDINSKKNWIFKLEKYQIPDHIRKSTYNYPFITALFWRKMNPVVMPKNQLYDIAVSLSCGLPSYYLRDKVKAKHKIYYFPIRQFSKDYRSISENIREQDIIYVGSQTMYSELMTDTNYKVSYYNDPYYNEAIKLAGKLEHKVISPQHQLNILSANGMKNKYQLEGFIHLCKKLKTQQSDFKWYLYGVGSYEQQTRKYLDRLDLKDNIIFIGEKANIYSYLMSADIYVEWNKHSSIYYEAEVLEKSHYKND